jgi:hypothetical protein
LSIDKIGAAELLRAPTIVLESDGFELSVPVGKSDGFDLTRVFLLSSLL